MGIIIAIILFSVIICFHELGHFALAKLNGIDVQEFALGMGPTLLSKEYKGTVYALKLLPLGGSCMMGEDDEETDAPGNFNNKPVLARMSVIFAGPAFNFIMAFVFAVILILMVGYDQPIVSSVEKDYPAYEAGIEAGDQITEINGKSIHVYREISMYNQFHAGTRAEITVERDGKTMQFTVVPKMDEELGYYRYGISGGIRTKATIGKAMQYGVYEVKYWIDVTLGSLKMLVERQVGLDQLSGPVGIVSTVDSSYQQSKEYGLFAVVAQMLYIGILLAANLGVMNLLPLPALDGGRLVFLIIELIRGKRVPPEKEGYVHTIGIVILLLLMVFVMFNDIHRLIK